MDTIAYRWNVGDDGKVFDVVFVRGTHGQPYAFSEAADLATVDIGDFFIGTLPVTQSLGPGEERVLGGGCFITGRFTARCRSGTRLHATPAMGASGCGSSSR